MDTLLVRAGAVLVAFVTDRLAGEPPARWHPVAWMGNVLAASGAPWPKLSPAGQFCRGAGCWLGGAATAFAAGWLITAGFGRVFAAPGVWVAVGEVLALGIVLKPMLSWRMLYDEVGAVEVALSRSTAEGRQQLSRLVSRDTRALDETVVRESALESLAENLNDSLVAPLFWFTLGGLPLAVLYRFANTADAMWGYRDRWEWAGKWAARADDALSYAPARLTALLLAIAGSRRPDGLRALARLTPSPNSGWPMGMLALVLRVRLSKPGVYELNAGGDRALAGHMAKGLRVCRHAAWLAVLLSSGVLLCLGLRG
jgi:adenosylcobinamide-phosphate synthase